MQKRAEKTAGAANPASQKTLNASHEPPKGPPESPEVVAEQPQRPLLALLLGDKREQLNIPIRVGRVRQIADRFGAAFSRGIATEARVDWLRVRSTMEPIGAKLRESKEPKDHMIAKFQLAAELLVNARRAINLNETWGSINRAGELLCSVAKFVKADEQERTLLNRMVGHEQSMIRWIVHLDNDVAVAKKLKKQLSKNQESSAKLEFYSQNWQRINDKMFFSLKLWRFACFALFFALAIAVGITEWATGGVMEGAIDGVTDEASGSVTEEEPDSSGPTLPYVMVALAGLFGGALSVLLTARSIKISSLTYATTRFRFIIRLLLGACGAFVVFALLNAFPTIFAPDIAQSMTKKAIGIIALGIIAGFSELLFQNALDRIAKRIPSSEPNDEEQDKTKTNKS